jgi:hypothetical protein
MSAKIDYGNLMHAAMRGLIRSVLEDVSRNGLPGNHHFFISFDTRHPDVRIADWLSQRYPADMTVVMQHWFNNLEVGEDGFAVTLNFGDSPEPLYIPFDAIRTFVDPSVEFGLRFDGVSDDDEDENDDDPTPPDGDPANRRDRKHVHPDAEVVSLDKFRK